MKDHILDDNVNKDLPLQFLFIEEKKKFNKKRKAVKLHQIKNNNSEKIIITSFYKPISRIFNE